MDQDTFSPCRLYIYTLYLLYVYAQYTWIELRAFQEHAPGLCSMLFLLGNKNMIKNTDWLNKDQNINLNEREKKK